MSFSSERSSRQTTSSLPRQDTATTVSTVSSLSTSCSNLETNDSTVSTNTITTSKNKNKSRKSRVRKHSIEHFIPSGDAKTLRTLKVHYYPEEQNWSVVIVVVATIVHVINHGLHLACGLFLVSITQSFYRVSFIYAGEF